MGRDVFYITTPIYYPNDVPHIGHAYNAVAADFIARYHRLRGEEVFHLTGTDEHGLKIQRAAEAAGVDPQQWVDDMEPKWREVWARLDIAYDDYIRTTEPRHEQAVQKLLNAVHDNGRDDIYLGTYEGLYCVACEAYYTEDELLEGGLCPIHERPVEHVGGELLLPALGLRGPAAGALRASTPSAVEPETRRNEVLSLIRGGLQDFSISRTSFTWGIPLPWDPEHICYVWFDALTNYITAAGYADDPERFARVWPADIHLIGKDILRFHAVYWPAMLMAARRRAADAGLGPRVPHGGRQEDVEDERHRDPPVRAARPVRHRLLPLLLHARDAVRRGRQLLAGSRWSSATTPTSPTGWATSPPGARDARLVLRRRGPRAGVEGAESDLPARDRRRRRPLRRAHAAPCTSSPP